MLNQVKNRIKILSERFQYEISYEREFMMLKNSFHTLTITNGMKKKLNISYKYDKTTSKLEIAPEYIFDVIISIPDGTWEKALLQNKKLITLQFFYETEGDVQFWEDLFTKARNDDKTNGIEQRCLGGNRILVEYFKGCLIFRDDLNQFASNIIILD